MNEYFARLARFASCVLAQPLAFAAAVLAVVLWGALGPVYHYNETWQLFINTGTTILTFLMIFLLQNSQNRDSRAAQVKLDELLRAVKGARNELINLENLTEEELARYCTEFQDLHLRYAKVLQKRGKHLEVKATVAEVTPEQKRHLNRVKRKTRQTDAV